jgi:hypothetical protein
MEDGMIVGFILGIPAFFLGFVLVIIGAIAVPAWILKWIIG